MTQEFKATVILIFTTIFAGLGWIFSKQAIAELPPFAFIGTRFVIASLLLVPFCYKSLSALSRQQVINAASVGVIMSGALLTWVTAISVTDTLAEGAFISSLAMLFAPFVGWLLFKQRPIRMFWVSLPFAVLGLGFLSLSNGYHHSPSQIWFLISAILLAFHFNFNAKYAQTIPSLALACIQLMVVGVVASIASLLLEQWPETISSTTWMWLGLSTIVATSLRYVMQTVGQKLTTSGNAAIIMILEPVWASSLSVVFYGDDMPIGKVIGCGLILWSLFVYRGGAKLLERRLQKSSL
ncbi:DMT family transporter [Vibrio gangliei]|uniref:DMT family transporter n=1 Tax=Vibrio gangliei TaxID=2077090 RepID=UPI000D01743E|nr:DMT family transporter [Vibrio gangliei]